LAISSLQVNLTNFPNISLGTRVIVVSEVDSLERNSVDRLCLDTARARLGHDRELGVTVGVAFNRRSVRFFGCESRVEPKGIMRTLWEYKWSTSTPKELRVTHSCKFDIAFLDDGRVDTFQRLAPEKRFSTGAKLR
jgi:hypothetical protein